ncbi:MAG TPA: OsmC family protein [Streptosporangiaceae bacterium]|nr:OsmC family protein [Streptosporangiaceae bacterium]
MIKAALKAGAIGGIIGGVMMAVWLMFILWLIGTGFWTLLNLITNTVWRSAPLGSKFSLTSVIIGLVVHVVVSFIFGSLIVLAAWRLPGPRSLIIASGALFGPVIWLVMQFGIWHAVDPAAAQVITPWVFAVAHLIFGVLAAATAAIIASDEKHSAASTQLTVADPLSPPAHAAGQQAALGAGRHAVHDARRRVLPTAGPAPRMAPEPPAALAAGPPPPDPAAPRSGPVWHRRRLTARNVGGLRTVVYTSGGPGMVTDEPVQYGGTGTALSPLETVLGALCGSTGATFATVAREVGFRYDGLDFEASFATDPPSPASQPGTRSYFQTVHVIVRVSAARPDQRLADVARMAERRCAVRNLLADAGVRVELRWDPVPPGAAAGVPGGPSAPGRPSNWA